MLLTGNVPVPIPKQIKGYEIVGLRPIDEDLSCDGCCFNNLYGCGTYEECSSSEVYWSYNEKNNT